ncbi:MAG: AraC family transcriptional regulator [Bacteroidota bacterium]
MTIKFEYEQLEEILFQSSYPKGFVSSNDGGLTERYYSAEMLRGLGGYKEIFMENIHIGYGDMQLESITEVNFKSEMETVELHFALAGDVLTQDAKSKREFLFGGNQHNIVYASNFCGKAHFPKRKDFKVFEINMSPEFFQRFLPENKKLFRSFRQAIERKESRPLSPHNYPISPAMGHLIQEILHCNRKGIFKRIFLESKVTELLLLQLEQIAGFDAAKACFLNNHEIDRMYAVKEYLERNLDQAQPIFQLAQRFGTNEYALKTGFKEVFGTTVFNFWQSAKMNEAKKMLLTGELNVSEVADQIGYKNPQHFSTAFKRKFGYSPSKLR